MEGGIRYHAICQTESICSKRIYDMQKQREIKVYDYSICILNIDKTKDEIKSLNLMIIKISV